MMLGHRGDHPLPRRCDPQKWPVEINRGNRGVLPRTRSLSRRISEKDRLRSSCASCQLLAATASGASTPGATPALQGVAKSAPHPLTQLQPGGSPRLQQDLGQRYATYQIRSLKRSWRSEDRGRGLTMLNQPRLARRARKRALSLQQCFGSIAPTPGSAGNEAPEIKGLYR